jgi:hypothetical protein
MMHTHAAAHAPRHARGRARDDEHAVVQLGVYLVHVGAVREAQRARAGAAMRERRMRRRKQSEQRVSACMRVQACVRACRRGCACVTQRTCVGGGTQKSRRRGKLIAKREKAQAAGTHSAVRSQRCHFAFFSPSSIMRVVSALCSGRQRTRVSTRANERNECKDVVMRTRAKRAPQAQNVALGLDVQLVRLHARHVHQHLEQLLRRERRSGTKGESHMPRRATGGRCLQNDAARVADAAHRA